MKKISIVTSCYNEEENLPELYRQLMEVLDELNGRYSYEIIIADNNSTDRSPQILRELAEKDKNVKVIFNSRNFGPDRSGYNALMQANGDAIVSMAADLQNPPIMIKKFIEKWEQGYKVVISVRPEVKNYSPFFHIANDILQNTGSSLECKFILTLYWFWSV